MSKDQKKTVEVPVEIVDNLYEMCNWITTTITFWHLSDKWPCNLIQDTIDEIIITIEPFKSEKQIRSVFD